MSPIERENLIKQYIPMTYKLARQAYSKFSLQGLELEDLASHGKLGLIRAIDRYDPQKGMSLSSYLWASIRWAIMNAPLDAGLVKRNHKLEKNQLVIEPNVEFDEQQITPDIEQSEYSSDLLAVKAAFQHLSPVLQQVMQGRLAGKSLEEVGSEIGRSKEWTRKLEEKAIIKLRGMLRVGKVERDVA